MYNNGQLNTSNQFGNTAVSEGTESELNMSMASNTARKKRAASRIDIAATYAKEPARARSLTIAQAKATGDKNLEMTARATAGVEQLEELPWYQCIHKLHYVCAVFALLGFILGMISFLTNFWYTGRINSDNRNNGLFWECSNGNCVTTDWRDIFWTPDCSLKSTSVQWSYYVNRGFIFSAITSCVIVFVVIMLSCKFYLDSMRCHSFVVIFFTLVPVISWCVAIARFAVWQDKELYCGKSFCEIQFVIVNSRDCEEGYGWSFILAVLCFILHIIGFAFALARHCFGEWTLEEAEGDDLMQTTRRVNVEHTLKRQRSNTKMMGSTNNLKAAAEPANVAPQQQQQQIIPGSPLVRNRAATMMQQNQQSRSISAAPSSSAETDPYNYAAKPGSAQQMFQQQIAAAQQQQGQQQYQAQDWVFDPNSGLDWSESLYLFRDPNTQHLYDPNTEKWFDPDIQQWYDGSASQQ